MQSNPWGAPTRFFNTAGPVRCAGHYCLDPLARIDLPLVEQLIGEGRYFVLHAPRQTGKTSSLLALAEHLNRVHYRAVYTNVAAVQVAREDVQGAMQAILSGLSRGAEHCAGDPYPGQVWPGVLVEAGPYGAFG